MLKKLTLVVAAVMAMASAANAVTVALNKGLSPGFTVQNAAGNATQSFIFIGTFTGGTDPAGGTAIPSIISSFKVFGTLAAPIASGATISGGVDYSGALAASNFNSLKMFMFVADSANLATATQVGLFGNVPVSSFPADVTAGGSVNFNVNIFANLEAIAGVGSKIDNATGADVVRLVPVPEPSAALLGAIGVVALLRRRR